MKNVKLNVELFDKAIAIRKELERIYPKCFFPVGSEKPLKVGIRNDLLAVREHLDINPIPTEEELSVSILSYVGNLSYRVSLAREGSVRVDLEGNETEPVSDNDRLTAKTKPLIVPWELTEEETTTINEQRERLRALRELRLSVRLLKQAEEELTYNKEQLKEKVEQAKAQIEQTLAATGNSDKEITYGILSNDPVFIATVKATLEPDKPKLSLKKETTKH